MDGNEINEILDNRLIRELRTGKDFQYPFDRSFSKGVPGSVTEQAHRIDAEWADGILTLSRRPTGPGYWIPYLESARLGTYTPIIQTSGDISWVVTGPFSGCHTTEFYYGNSVVFAHLITAAPGAPPVDSTTNQIHNIKGILRIRGLNFMAGSDRRVPCDDGFGYVFWTFHNGHWYRRDVRARPSPTSKVPMIEVVAIDRADPI